MRELAVMVIGVLVTVAIAHTIPTFSNSINFVGGYVCCMIIRDWARDA